MTTTSQRNQPSIKSHFHSISSPSPTFPPPPYKPVPHTPPPCVLLAQLHSLPSNRSPYHSLSSPFSHNIPFTSPKKTFRPSTQSSCNSTTSKSSTHSQRLSNPISPLEVFENSKTLHTLTSHTTPQRKLYHTTSPRSLTTFLISILSPMMSPKTVIVFT